jgi:hypothetical protein
MSVPHFAKSGVRAIQWALGPSFRVPPTPSGHSHSRSRPFYDNAFFLFTYMVPHEAATPADDLHTGRLRISNPSVKKGDDLVRRPRLFRALLVPALLCRDRVTAGLAPARIVASLFRHTPGRNSEERVTCPDPDRGPLSQQRGVSAVYLATI